MDKIYFPAAQNLANQRKARNRVVKRQKAAKNILIGAVTVGLITGMNLLILRGAIIEDDIRTKKIDDYISDNYEHHIGDEAKAQMDEADREFYYGSEQIGKLKISTINEYGILIDAIVENEGLKINSDVKPLNSSRLDQAIANYANFKNDCNNDKVDYAVASEEIRLQKAHELYNTKKDVLGKQLIEATQKSKYLVVGTDEHAENEEKIEKINGSINSIKEALRFVIERTVTLEVEKQKAEDGKHR